MLPLSPLASTRPARSVNVELDPTVVGVDVDHGAGQTGADDAAVVAVDADRAGDVGQLDARRCRSR